MRVVNQETITGTLSLFKVFPLNGFNPIRAKQRLHRRRKRVYESSSSRRKNQELFHWNLETLAKIQHGIIELQHLVDPRQMASLKEPFEGTSAVLLKSGLDERWWSDSMECRHLRNVQDLLAAQPKTIEILTTVREDTELHAPAHISQDQRGDRGEGG